MMEFVQTRPFFWVHERGVGGVVMCPGAMCKVVA